MRLVRATTRQVEPEWGDEDRALAEGLSQYGHEVCPGCHIHPAIVDELGSLTWEDRLCKVCRSSAVHGRVVAARDEEWREKHPKAEATAVRPSDGLHPTLRPATPEEIAEQKARRRGRG